MNILRYIKGRLSEPSTWVAFGAGAAAANALEIPWSYIAIGCAIIGAVVPEKRNADS